MTDVAYYTAKQKNVYGKLLAKGAAMTLLDNSADVLDKSTGGFTEGTAVSYPTYGLILKDLKRPQKAYTKGIDSTDIKTYTEIMVANYDPATLTGFPIKVDTRNTLLFESEELTIVESKPFRIGGIIVYYNLVVHF